MSSAHSAASCWICLAKSATGAGTSRPAARITGSGLRRVAWGRNVSSDSKMTLSICGPGVADGSGELLASPVVLVLLAFLFQVLLDFRIVPALLKVLGRGNQLLVGHV